MNELTIDDESFHIRDLKIDIANKEIIIIEDNISSKIYNFFQKYIIWDYDKNISKLLYLKDKDDNIYTFYGCYIGKSSLKDNKINLKIKFQAFVTNYYIEDIRNYNIDKMEILIEYKQFDLVQIEECIGTNLKFNIGNMQYNIELIFNSGQYKITLKNKKQLITDKFIHKFLQFYEFLILNLGYYLKIKKIKLYNFGKSFEYYYPFSSKYIGTNNYNNYTCVLSNINRNDVKKAYKNWLAIRKDTHTIFDIYMNVFSVKYFIEIALSTITNCMEGYYKIVHKSTIKIKYKDKNGVINTRNKDFKEIMKEYLNSNEGKIIFSNMDRQRLKLYTRLRNHRNYFAHLDKKKKRFYGESNLYVLLKIRLLFRVFILKDIGLNIEIKNLTEQVRSIEEDIKWKENKNIYFSLK